MDGLSWVYHYIKSSIKILTDLLCKLQKKRWTCSTAWRWCSQNIPACVYIFHKTNNVITMHWTQSFIWRWAQTCTSCNTCISAQMPCGYLIIESSCWQKMMTKQDLQSWICWACIWRPNYALPNTEILKQYFGYTFSIWLKYMMTI